MPFGTDRSKSKGVVVLAVDDEPIVLKVVSSILARSGYRVLTAASAEEALGIFEREPWVDLLLADVILPGRSGPELAETLLSRQPALRVLFTAGMPDSPMIRAGVLDKGYELIPKPFQAAELAARVRRVLEAPRARSANST